MDTLLVKAAAAFSYLAKIAKGYHQGGSSNNNYKGPGKRSYSADHKEAAKKITATKCSRCGSTKNVQRAEKHGEAGHYIQLCASCHAKYDNRATNINGK